MSPARRRVVIWAVVLGGAFLAHALLARHLANQDPISEMLLGRAGLVLPIATVVLLLRFALYVVLPVLAALVAARVILDEI